VIPDDDQVHPGADLRGDLGRGEDDRLTGVAAIGEHLIAGRVDDRSRDAPRVRQEQRRAIAPSSRRTGRGDELHQRRRDPRRTAPDLRW
jgi:hypothetical protein